MPEFSSFAQLANELARVARSVPKATEKALEKIGKHVEMVAKDKIGEYQDASGEFSAWEQLTEATQADRVQKGYPANDPLIRSGELYGSTSHSVTRSGQEQTLSVGSDLDLGLWQELGTDKIPPRPFIGPAMFENEKLGQDILGAAI